MDKHRTHIFIALVLVLLIVAAVCAWLTGSSIHNGSEQTPSPSQSQDVAPSDEPGETTEPTAEPSPSPTQSAEPTPTPTPSPSATPEPTPTPDPGTHTRSVSQSGSFVCSTGTNLSLQGKWSVSSYDDSNLSVTVDIYAYSYTLHIGGRSGVVSIGGQQKSFTSPGIDITNDNKLTETKIGSVTVLVPCELGESVSIPMSIDWSFNAQYNKKDIGTVSGGDTIAIQG